MNFLTLLIIGLTIGILGYISNTLGNMFNYTALSTNKNKMPVLITSKTNWVEDKLHFPFTKKSEVKNYYLCDIYRIKISKKTFYFSIGDILLLSSGPMMILGYTLSILSLFFI